MTLLSKNHSAAADLVQAEKLKSLKLTAGLIYFSTFTDRVVPLKVLKMI